MTEYTKNDGFPAETVEGETVRIVKKIHGSGDSARETQVLVSEDGRHFVPTKGAKVEEIEVLVDAAHDVDLEEVTPEDELEPAEDGEPEDEGDEPAEDEEPAEDGEPSGDEEPAEDDEPAEDAEASE